MWLTYVLFVHVVLWLPESVMNHKSLNVANVTKQLATHHQDPYSIAHGWQSNH